MSTSVNITSEKIEISSEEESSEILTEVSDVIAGLVECSPIELEADDGEDDDGKEEEEGDVHQGTDGLRDGGHHHLETWKKDVKVSSKSKFSQQSCSKYCFNNLSLASTINLLSRWIMGI